MPELSPSKLATLFSDGFGKAFWMDSDNELHWGETHYKIFESLFGTGQQMYTAQQLATGIFGWIFPSDEDEEGYMIDFGTDFGYAANKSNPELQREAVRQVEKDIGYPADKVFWTYHSDKGHESKVAGVKVNGSEYQCFGFVNGILYLGNRHHMAIMQQILDHGYTFEDLMNARQLWGWLSTYKFTMDDAGEIISHEPSIGIGLTTDAGSMDKDLIPSLKEAFARLTGIINIQAEDNVYQSNDEYAPKLKKVYGPNGYYNAIPQVLKFDPESGQQELWGSVEKLAANIDMDRYSCFGYIDGILFLGLRHHMAIMNYVIENKIMTWEQLMSAEQVWGWLFFRQAGQMDMGSVDPAKALDIDPTSVKMMTQNGTQILEEDHGYFRATTDAASISPHLIPEVSEALTEAYGIPFAWNGGLWQTNNAYAPSYNYRYQEGQGAVLGDIGIYLKGVGWLTPEQATAIMKEKYGEQEVPNQNVPGGGNPPPKMAAAIWEEDESIYELV